MKKRIAIRIAAVFTMGSRGGVGLERWVLASLLGCWQIIGPEGVTTVSIGTIGVEYPSDGLVVVTGVWHVLGSGVTIALAVGGDVACTADGRGLWSGEEHVGEWGLETLGGWGVLGGVRVRVLKLYPDFLDGTELTKVELVICRLHTRDGQCVTAH